MLYVGKFPIIVHYLRVILVRSLTLDSNRHCSLNPHAFMYLHGSSYHRRCLGFSKNPYILGRIFHTRHYSYLQLPKISLLMPSQNMHIWARRIVLVLPKCDVCNLARHICLCDSGITIRLPLRIKPLTMQSSSQKEKYCLTVSWHSSAVRGHPSAIYHFNS